MEFIGFLMSMLFTIGITLGVGSSTFALVFYIAALANDGTIDQSERRFLGIVYFMLRVAMALIAIGLIGAYFIGFPATPGYLMQWTLLIIITVNAVLMTLHMMPMRFGPVLAGGSWYGLFLITELPFFATTYLQMFIGYVIFLVVFFFVFEYLKKMFLPPAGNTTM